MISAPALRFSAPIPSAGFRPRASSSSSRIRCSAAVASAAPAGTRGTLYEVLGLRAGATCREIKAAYRRLARERHPDVAGGAADFIALHDAYATLSDPDARARYDRGVVSTAFARGAATRPRWGRTWETDQCW